MSPSMRPDYDTPSATTASYDTPPAALNDTPPALIAFTLAVLILCFVAFSIVYLCRYCFSSVIHTWAFQRTASGTLIRGSPDRSHPRGLDPSLLEMFPTFLYASVKDLRKEKTYSLECAICLLEFEDDSMLRLLTVCCHVFHQKCIDLWLDSHDTCPVCRKNLNSPPKEMPKSEYYNNNYNAQEGMVSSTSNDISIDIKEGEGDGGGGGASAGDERKSDHKSIRRIQQQEEEEQRITRSHSTGHSIVMIREGEGNGEKDDDDKYTLRLPEHVIRARHNCSRSCATDKEMTRPPPPPPPCSNCGFVQPVSGSYSHGPA